MQQNHPATSESSPIRLPTVEVNRAAAKRTETRNGHQTHSKNGHATQRVHFCSQIQKQKSSVSTAWFLILRAWAELGPGLRPGAGKRGRFPHSVGEMSRSDKGGRPACGRRPRYGRRCQMSVLYWRMVRSLEKGPALAMFIRHLRAKASRSCA